MSEYHYRIIMPGTRIGGAGFNEIVTLEQKQGDRLVARGILAQMEEQEVIDLIPNRNLEPIPPSPNFLPPAIEPPFDINDDADAVIPKVRSIDDIHTLELLMQHEQSGRNRKGVKNEIMQRIEELQQP